MTPAQAAVFGRASNALRFAEGLATGAVAGAGPSDTPPANESLLPEWFRDWTNRARNALSKTYHEVLNAPEAAREAIKERAHKIGSALREAAEALKSVSPFHAVANNINAVSDAAKSLEGLTRAAVPGILILALLWLFSRSNK